MNNNGVVPSCSQNGNNNKISEEKKTVKIRVSVFFDGTANNRSNVAARRGSEHLENLYRTFDTDEIEEMKYALEYKKVEFKSSSARESYENDYSNIVKLEKHLEDKRDESNKHIKLYIEGIGTEDYKTDSLIGKALGSGGTGIQAKVSKGIDLIVKNIVKLVNTEETIEELFIDAFGFSRGAAAARNFIYEAKVAKGRGIKKRLVDRGYDVGVVEVLFAGLFDTVASYGLPISHPKNPEHLNLNAVSEAKAVVHLVAKDEYRKNFSLTNIKSKGSKEIFLPGAHSDIGGGYKDDMYEENIQVLDLKSEARALMPIHSIREMGPVHSKTLDDVIKRISQRFETEKEWLVKEGWLTKEEVLDKDFLDIDFSTFVMKMNRKEIKNTYSIIPLRIMKKYASDNGLRFRSSFDVKEPKPTDKDLVKLQEILGENGQGNWWSGEKKEDLLRRVRRRFFHFSAYYGETAGAFDPNFINDNKWSSRERNIHDDVLSA